MAITPHSWRAEADGTFTPLDEQGNPILPEAEGGEVATSGVVPDRPNESACGLDMRDRNMVAMPAVQRAVEQFQYATNELSQVRSLKRNFEGSIFNVRTQFSPYVAIDEEIIYMLVYYNDLIGVRYEYDEADLLQNHNYKDFAKAHWRNYWWPSNLINVATLFAFVGLLCIPGLTQLGFWNLAIVFGVRWYLLNRLRPQLRQSRRAIKAHMI